MENVTPSMLVTSTMWQNQESFRMIPATKDCPFNEAIYDPSMKVLAIVSKEIKEKPHMMHRLDDKGKVVPVKPKNAEEAKTPQYAEMRVMVDSYYEYYIETVEDIAAFVSTFAINNGHPALQAFMPVEAPVVSEKVKTVKKSPKKATVKAK